MIKKPTPQKLNQHIMFISYNRKQIAKEAKSFL